jgi:hypothetical protein
MPIAMSAQASLTPRISTKYRNAFSSRKRRAERRGVYQVAVTVRDFMVHPLADGRDILLQSVRKAATSRSFEQDRIDLVNGHLADLIEPVREIITQLAATARRIAVNIAKLPDRLIGKPGIVEQDAAND